MLINSILEGKPSKVHKSSGEEMIDLAAQTFVWPRDFEFQIVEVSEDIEARPDIISQNVYGTDKYGDLICKINDIRNPFELSAGTILIIPEVNYLKDFFTREVIDFGDFGDKPSEDKPRPKRKNERRRPNEAVIGDVRYKIDKSSRIIYY